MTSILDDEHDERERSWYKQNGMDRTIGYIDNGKKCN